MPCAPQNASFRIEKGAKLKSSLEKQRVLRYALLMGDLQRSALLLHDQPLHDLPLDALLAPLQVLHQYLTMASLHAQGQETLISPFPS